MAAAKATRFILVLALALSFVVASSAAVPNYPHAAGAGRSFGFGGIPNFGQFGGGQGQRGGVRGAGGWGAGGVGGWGAGGVGGWGAGRAGPGGGFARRGVVQPSTVCKEKGPCFNKRLVCPSRCFRSYSYKGKNSAGGGGGGGCSFDCTNCQARC